MGAECWHITAYACTHLEEHRIILQKLWQVAISESPDEHHVLIFVRVLSLERAGHDQHRLECSHAKVVVILLRQLLGGELVHLRHLLGQVLGGLETLRVQDHLSDQTYSPRCEYNM